MKKFLSYFLVNILITASVYYIYNYNKITKEKLIKPTVFFKQNGQKVALGIQIYNKDKNIVTLTAKHVCTGVATKEGLVEVSDSESDVIVQRKILDISDVSDLCLIEAVNPKLGALAISSSIKIGEELNVLATQPQLNNILVFEKHELIGTDSNNILDFIVPEHLDSLCNKENQIKKYEDGFCFCFTQGGEVGVFLSIAAGPGSSGGPIVNEKMELIGLLVGGKQIDHIVIFVMLKDIREFLGM